MKKQNLKNVLSIGLWAIYPVLFLYGVNRSLCTVELLWASLGVSLAASLLLLFIFSKVFRSMEKGACFTVLFIILFHLFGRVESLLMEWEAPWFLHMCPPGHQMLGVTLTVLSFAGWKLYRSKNLFKGGVHFLLTAGAILCVLPLFSPEAKVRTSDGVHSLTLEPPDQRPDVYIIVADAYASNKVLLEQYGFDNTAMSNWLKQEGFYVAEQSRSNYGMSILSMTSAFNLNYVEEFFPPAPSNDAPSTLLKPFLNYNVFFESLRKLGYRTATFDAAVFGLMRMDSSDLFFKTPGVGLNLLEQELMNTSAADYLLSRGKVQNGETRAAFHRHRINYALDQLAALPQKKGPLLAYAHIICPHQPFVFLADGSPRPFHGKFGIWFRGDEVKNKARYKEAYIEQVQYMNERLQTVIQALKNSTRPSVIVLLSDHGPAMGLNISSFEKTNLEERFSITANCYFPDGDYSALYSSVTPINLFRIVLNKYFSANLPLLEDRSFYSTWDEPYRMTPVPPIQ